MAAVTEVTPRRVHNLGDLDAVTCRVSVATTGDTFTHGLRAVESIICPPRTNLTDVADNGSGAIVFTTGAAVANIDITILGYP